MSTVAITFAEELRARSEEDLGAIFKFRPDLVTPVPNDFSALAARATSTPSLVRALDSLNLWHYQIIEAACVLPEPFKKSEFIIFPILSPISALGKSDWSTTGIISKLKCRANL